MKKTFLRYGLVSLLSLAFATTITSCGKYEDGPGISLRSRENRVENKWRLAKVTENGSVVTSDYSGVTYEFKDGGIAVWSYSSGGSSLSVEGKWELVDDDKYLRISIDRDSYKYKILELRSKYLTLRLDKAGMTTIIELEEA